MPYTNPLRNFKIIRERRSTIAYRIQGRSPPTEQIRKLLKKESLIRSDTCQRYFHIIQRNDSFIYK